MTDEEKRDEVIESLTNLLRTTPFSVEFKVKKKPQGIKIIYEMTQEQMDAMMKMSATKEG